MRDNLFAWEGAASIGKPWGKGKRQKAKGKKEKVSAEKELLAARDRD